MKNFTKAKRNCAFMGVLGGKIIKGRVVDWCSQRDVRCGKKGCPVVKIYSKL
jgi:hypothetical protein